MEQEKEKYIPKFCKGVKADGTRCTLYAMHDSEYCHYHRPDRVAQRRAVGRAVGLLPKIHTGDIMKIDSVEDILDFAKRRMSLIARRGNLEARMKEELIQRWAQFILPILRDRDDLKKRLDKLEGKNVRP